MTSFPQYLVHISILCSPYNYSCKTNFWKSLVFDPPEFCSLSEIVFALTTPISSEVKNKLYFYSEWWLQRWYCRVPMFLVSMTLKQFSSVCNSAYSFFVSAANSCWEFFVSAANSCCKPTCVLISSPLLKILCSELIYPFCWCSSRQKGI